MKINKIKLMLIAGSVWSLAGINVLIIGTRAYGQKVSPYDIVLSLIILCLFWFLVFKKMVKKHCTRIEEMKEARQEFWKFFDIKSYLIMFFMIILGVSIRMSSLVSEKFIAVFYSGLGFALFLAGLSFLENYIRAIKKDS